MALIIEHKGEKFGIGDTVKVTQIIEDADKKRQHIFEGIVIAIKGREENKTFTVRRIGFGQVGIERIFPLKSPNIKKVERTRKGTRGVKSAKLYYIREKSKKEIEKIYDRAKSKSKSESKVKTRAKANKKHKTTDYTDSKKITRKKSVKSKK